MVEKLREDAAKLLKNKKVNVIIGYGKAYDERHPIPIFIHHEDDICQLIFNSYCFSNLVVFLNHPEIKKMGKVGMLAKEKDMKAIITLVQETQINPENVVILGIQAREMHDVRGKWHYLGIMDIEAMVNHININSNSLGFVKKESQLLEKIEKMSYKERWDYWNREFSKCIRCYACRQACPLCYCNKCIVEKNQPQWVSTNIDEKGKFTWNIIRAFHLAGRCVGCGECERACPMGIPIMALNNYLATVVFNEFGYLAGHSTEEKPPLTTFKEDDKEEFIL